MANDKEEIRLEGNMVDHDDPDILPCCYGGRIFEIHVRGHLSSQWSDWLEGLEVKLLDNGEMILQGTIVDQAALMGILNKLNRLNLPLISVSEIKEDQG
jgi:hypothetical protein